MLMRLRMSILFLLVFYGCENNLERVKLVASRNDAALEHGREVEVLYSSKGKVLYKVKGPGMIRHNTENPFIEFPESVKIYFYDDSLRMDSWLTAGYGISYENKGMVIVRRQVVLQNTKGEKLETEELIWDEKKKKIYSDKYTTITTTEEVIYGDGFEADEDFSHYRIRKIRGSFQLKENEQG